MTGMSTGSPAMGVGKPPTLLPQPGGFQPWLGFTPTRQGSASVITFTNDGTGHATVSFDGGGVAQLALSGDLSAAVTTIGLTTTNLQTQITTNQTSTTTALAGKQSSLGYVPANKAGDTFSGGITVQGDITLFRPGAPGTGYQFFGNSGSRYIGFDGSQFVTNGQLNTNGNPFYSGSVSTGAIGSSSLSTGGISASSLTTGSDIYCGGNINSNNYYTRSDLRLKTDVKDADEQGSFIDSLKVHTFLMNGELRIGLIAQEVQVIDKNYIVVGTEPFSDTDPDPILSIKIADIQFAMLAALQETRAALKDALVRIAVLEGK